MHGTSQVTNGELFMNLEEGGMVRYWPVAPAVRSSLRCIAYGDEVSSTAARYMLLLWADTTLINARGRCSQFSPLRHWRGLDANEARVEQPTPELLRVNRPRVHITRQQVDQPLNLYDKRYDWRTAPIRSSRRSSCADTLLRLLVH